MEKLINEFRVIETDDGFRIEIKGDKEHLKRFIEHGPFGKKGPFGRRWHRRAHFGPMFFGHGFGAGVCCGPWDEEAADEEESEAEAAA